jgi:hypothetical protein
MPIAAMPPPLEINPEHARSRCRRVKRTTMSRTRLSSILAACLGVSAPLCAHHLYAQSLLNQEATEDTTHETATAPEQRQGQMQPAQPPDFGDPRFAFHRVDNGFVRLDLRTGAVASCSQQVAGWACVAAPEERAAFESEIARLRRDNATLKQAMLEHGLPLPSGMAPDVPAAPAAAVPRPQEPVPRPPQSVPPVASAPPGPPPGAVESDRARRDDAELERVMAMMEKVWRRLVEMMVTIQRDMQKKG